MKGVKEHSRKKARRGIFLSIFALIVVLIAMPASFGAADWWNSQIANEYVEYTEWNNETRGANDGYLLGSPPASSVATNGIAYFHYNATGYITEIPDWYDKSIFNDGYYRAVLTGDSTDNATKLDYMVFAINITAGELANAGATRIYIHFDVGKTMNLKVAFQGDTATLETIYTAELNSTNNYTSIYEIDLATLLSIDSKVPNNQHISIAITSYNETEEFEAGDVAVFSLQLQKKQGNIATIVTVDNLMMAWGVILIGFAFASTPFFNPLSRDVFPVWSRHKRKKAAKKASAHRKRKKSRKKSKRRRR